MTRIDTHTAEVYINNPYGQALNPAYLVAGVNRVDYSLDVDRSPYVVAKLEGILPDAATLATWDPRTSPRLIVSLEQRFGVTDTNPGTLADASAVLAGGTLADASAESDVNLASVSALVPAVTTRTEWNPGGQPTDFTQIFATLIVTEVEPNYRDRTVSITAMSGEFLLEDKIRLRAWDLPYGTITLHDLVTEVVDLVGGTAGFSVQGDANPTLSGEVTTWKIGDSLSTFIDPILAVYGLRLYAEGDSEFVTARIGEHSGFGLTSTVPIDYREGMSNAIQSMSISGGSDRNSWYDGAVVIYEWYNAANDRQRAVDVYPETGVHRRGVTIDRTTPFPGIGAAQGIVERSRKRGVTTTVDVRTNYAITPGWTASTTLPGETAPTSYQITALAFSYPQAEMTMTLQSTIGQE